jgi:E3 ubiquitin-protein ligase SIAH1
MSAIAVMANNMSQLRLDDLNDSIVSLFQCPVCCNYMVPPIYQCKNAHNFCSKCIPQLTKCPSCEDVFLDSRNVFVEQIAERLLFPCMNLEGGCCEKGSLLAIISHHEVCPHRTYECLPGKTDNCKWMGRGCDILAHTADAHANN